MPSTGLPISRSRLWGILVDELGEEDEEFKVAIDDLKTPVSAVVPDLKARPTSGMSGARIRG